MFAQLSQKRFIADGSADEANSQWMVPIEIATSRSPSKVCHSFVLEGSSAEIVLDDIQPDEWFKINPGQVRSSASSLIRAPFRFNFDRSQSKFPPREEFFNFFCTIRMRLCLTDLIVCYSRLTSLHFQ